MEITEASLKPKAANSGTVRDQEAWCAAVHGVAKSEHDWKQQYEEGGSRVKVWAGGQAGGSRCRG